MTDSLLTMTDTEALAAALHHAEWPPSTTPRGYGDPKWTAALARVVAEALAASGWTLVRSEELAGLRDVETTARTLVDDWIGDDDEESEPFCMACGMRRDLPHDERCTFVALRAALEKGTRP